MGMTHGEIRGAMTLLGLMVVVVVTAYIIKGVDLSGGAEATAAQSAGALTSPGRVGSDAGTSVEAPGYTVEVASTEEIDSDSLMLEKRAAALDRNDSLRKVSRREARQHRKSSRQDSPAGTSSSEKSSRKTSGKGRGNAPERPSPIDRPVD